MGWTNYTRRRRREAESLPIETDTEPVKAAIENAWKIHSALIDWTGKVDTKASFALALEAAVLSGVVALTRPSQPLSQIDSIPGKIALIGGVVLLGIGATFSVLVVIPRTRSRYLARESPRNYIYFGHLKQWDPVKLSDKLKSSPDELLLTLSRQLINMSRIAWIKHKRVQFSLALAWLGVIAVGASALIS